MRFSPPKILLFSVFFLLAIRYTLYADSTSAQIPKPRVPCGAEKDPEFNSLRPYQASPCGNAPQAKFCGNKIIIQETKDEKDTFPEGNGGCNPTKKVNWVNDENYWIDLSETEFPIAGNTEQVQNSQNSEDKFDDARKVNEYASWYLNGVISRAEYGDAKNTDNEIVNLSGPVQKLLPSVILEAQRITSIENASTEVETEDEDGKITSQPVNHNQIVVCAQEGLLGIIGKAKPHECYAGNGSASKPDTYRLKDWEGDLSIFNGIANRLGTDVWNKRTPPLPWADENGKPFESDILYQKAYNEWQGKTCAIVPIIGTLVCIDNPLIANKWADLYQYIPLANTADRQYKMPIYTTTIQPSAGTIMTDKQWGVLPGGEPVLYFPHAHETKELSELLNKTYIPSEAPSGEIDPKTTEQNLYSTTDPNACKTVDVRSNEGDDLFPIHEPGDIGVRVYFKVTEIPLVDCKLEENPKTGEFQWVGKYSGLVTIEIHTDPVQVPWADVTWKSTVAGPTSTFRKIFPKVEEGAPVSCIADIPSETKAVYRPVEGTDKIGVASLQNPEQKFDPEDARIYFPHWGSIYEYFLKGIQTALRPQGYGEPLVNGKLCENQEEEKKECDVNVPDSAVDSKYLGTFKSNFIDLANRWATGCEGPENNMAEECYNYVASEAKKAGVNPGFALTIWLNESGASNYCAGGETTQDFGINLSNIYQNIVEQLKAFLNMAKQKLCEGVPGFIEPMHGWLSRFQSSAGVCDPNDQVATDYYYEVMGTTWTWITNCVKNGLFGITWPTDSSCP